MAKDYQYLLQDLEQAEKRSRPRINPDQKLSLCMIVRNEEKYLEDALKSAQDVVDEIIVVDTGSTDSTVEIARRYGAKVYFKEWQNDFSAARNESLRHATGEWVLVMDADERIPDECKDNLRTLLIPTDQAISYLTYIRNYMREEQESSVLGHYVVRLFRKTPETQFFGVIHEQLYPNWGEVTIPENTFYLLHLGYGDLEKKERKLASRNLPLIQKALDETKDKNPTLYSFYAYYMGSSLTDPQEVKKWMKASIDNSPEPQKTPHIPVAYLDYLRAFYYAREFAEGIAVAKEALDKLPSLDKYPDFWEGYATLLMANHQFDEAIESFEKALQLVSEESEDVIFFAARKSQIGGWGTLLNIGLAYALKQDGTKAQEYFRKALELYPGDDKSLLADRIDKIMGNQELTHAYFEDRLKNSQEKNPADLKALSNIYLKQEKPFEALMIQHDLHGAEKAIQTALQLGKTYQQHQRLDLARKTYEGILSWEPDCLPAQLGLKTIGLLETNAAPEEAELEVLAAKASKLEDWQALGEFCLQFGALPQAAQAFEKALEQDANAYDAHLFLALVQQESDDIQGAIRRLQNLITQAPEKSAAYTQLGNLCLVFGQFKEAETMFQHLVEHELADWYSYYALGVALSGQEKFAEARAELEKARQRAPRQPGPLNLLELIAQAEKQPVEQSAN